MTGTAIEYQPYQQALANIDDIPEWACREAARLVDVDGTVYNGPEAAYKALHMARRWTCLLPSYNNSDFFRYLSDHGYMWVAAHRNFLFTITRALWGKNPAAPRRYWLYYLLFALAVCFAAFIFLIAA